MTALGSIKMIYEANSKHNSTVCESAKRGDDRMPKDFLKTFKTALIW